MIYDLSGNGHGVGQVPLGGDVIPTHRLIDQAVKTEPFTFSPADSGTRIPTNGTFTITAPAVSTLGNGFGCEIIASSSGTITVDGPGGTNLIIGPSEVGYLFVTAGVLIGAKSPFSVLG